MAMAVTSGSLGGVMVSVVVYTDLSGKEPHRQVGVDTVATSGSLGGVMVRMLNLISPLLRTPLRNRHPDITDTTPHSW